MSRVAKNPIPLPKGVDVKLDGRDLTVKGGMGSLGITLTEGIGFGQEDNVLTLSYDKDKSSCYGRHYPSLVE